MVRNRPRMGSIAVALCIVGGAFAFGPPALKSGSAASPFIAPPTSQSLVPMIPRSLERASYYDRRAGYYDDDRGYNRGYSQGFYCESIPKNALVPTERYLLRCPGHQYDGEVVTYHRGRDGKTYVQSGIDGRWKRTTAAARFYPAYGASNYDTGYSRSPSSFNYGYGEKRSYYVKDPMSTQGYYGDRMSYGRSIPKSALVEGERYLFRSSGHDLDGAIVMYRRGSDRYHYVRAGLNDRWKKAGSGAKFYSAQGRGYGNDYDRRSRYGDDYDRRSGYNRRSGYYHGSDYGDGYGSDRYDRGYGYGSGRRDYY